MIPDLKTNLENLVKKHCLRYVVRFEEDSKTQDINLVLNEVFHIEADNVKKIVRDHLNAKKYEPIV